MNQERVGPGDEAGDLAPGGEASGLAPGHEARGPAPSEQARDTEPGDESRAPAAEATQAPGRADRIDTREACERALLAAHDEAARTGARHIVLADLDFAVWPLGKPAVVEAFSRWARSHHRLTLLAADFGPLQASAPRWLAWRRQWAHVVQCLAVHEELVPALPSLLFVPGLVALPLHDRERVRGTLSRAPLELARWADVVDALTQRADESLPVTTLGL